MLDLSSYDEFSLDGLTMHLQSTSLVGGRKLISNEYPYRDQRYIQDLGGLERKFTINCLIDDNDGFETKEKILKLLESGEQMEMLHPDYGDKKVFCISYTVDNDYIGEVGLSRITLNLEIASLNIFPIRNKSKGLLARLKSAILGKNEEKFNKAWKAVKKVKNTLDSGAKTLQSVSKQMKQVAKSIQGAGDSFGKLTTGLNELTANARQLVLSPSVLASKMKANFENLKTAYSTAKDVFSIARDLVNLKFNDVKKDNNNTLLIDYMRANAMATCYEQVVLIDFDNANEVENIIKDMEEAFKNVSTTTNSEVYNLLKQARSNAINLLQDLAVSLPKLDTITLTNPLSLHNLAYALYSDTSYAEKLAKLNNIIDMSEVEGKILIFKNA